MSLSKQNKAMDPETADPNERRLYTLAGVTTSIAILSALLDVFLSFGGADLDYGALTAVEWFARFQANAFLGLRDLGLLNIISMACMVPVLLALYTAHRQADKTFAALAMIVHFLGAAIYVSNNAAIPMLVLSGKYAAAATEAQRSLLAAAGEALLAQGEDFTPGFVIGFVLVEIAIIAISWVMLRSRVFSRATAYTGILGLTLLTIHTLWLTFVPAWPEMVMTLGMVGGLLGTAWYVQVALRLFQLGRGIQPQTAQ